MKSAPFATCGSAKIVKFVVSDPVESPLSQKIIVNVILLKKPMNASTRLSMNGKSPKISTSPPFVLRPSKDERRVFQQNLNVMPDPVAFTTMANLYRYGSIPITSNPRLLAAVPS